MMGDAKVGSASAIGTGVAALTEENRSERRGRVLCPELVFEPGVRAESGDGALLAWHACAPSGRVVWVCPAQTASGLEGDHDLTFLRLSTRGDVLEVGPSTDLAEIPRSLSRIVDPGDAVFVGSVHRLISTIGLEDAMTAVGEIVGWCAREGNGFVVSCDPEEMTNSEIRRVIREFEKVVGA